ncbi:dCTP deaminase [Candidatus Woesearchaeota archaeon]|nr:dCTP deaminase [Candidatus Woesearchaeota archaeon]
MILSTKKLLLLIHEQKLIEHLCERELNNPEGTGFDLRVAKLFQITSPTFLGVTQRESSSTTLLAEIGKQQSYTLQSGEYVLAQTIETLNMPSDLVAFLSMRSILFRGGVMMLMSAKVDPGYQGPLVVGLKNVGPHPFTVELGARFMHIQFAKIDGDNIRSYEGQWQGGRLSTNGRETQN